MKRRSFIKNVSLASVSVPLVVNKMPFEAISKELFEVPKMYEDRVLVIIRLNGGNDGLNTVIPINQYDNLMIQRENIIIPENQILPINATNGFHPVMTGMRNLFNDGKLSIIQNVGYPEQNRSHFRSMDIWTSGMMDVSATTGWLGRHWSVDHPNFPTGYPNTDNPHPFAISMGYEVSATCQGLLANFSHTVVDPFQASNLPNSTTPNDGTYYGAHMEYLSGIIAQTNAYGQVITSSANAGNTLSTLYDNNNNLAKQLRYVAQMISGGLKTKVYVLNINGFDTHDSQVTQTNTTQGMHANLMKQVSDAIYAFQDDLRLLGIEQRVAGMTFSEFGRQIASNASYGTDHGDAAPLFLFGGCVTTSVIGSDPIVPDQVVNQAGLPLEFDFRDVYASVLRDWFGVDETRVQSMFEHEVSFLNILNGCNLSTSSVSKDEQQAMVYPNPCGSQATLKLTIEHGEKAMRVHIIDMSGKLVVQVLDKTLEAGVHQIPLDVSELPLGSYRVHVLHAEGSRSLGLVKVRNL